MKMLKLGIVGACWLMVCNSAVVGCAAHSSEQQESPTRTSSLSESHASQGETTKVQSAKSETPPATQSKPAGDSGASAAMAPQKGSTSTSAVSDVLEVKRLVVATDVKEREPIAASSPRTGQPLVAFVEAKNLTKTDMSVVVAFVHESGKKVGNVELAIPAERARYRTWARTRNISEPGKWTAIVSKVDGTELARETFEVTGA